MAGGHTVKNVSQYPYMASVLNIKSFTFCGGSIISEYYVLTAGHCLTPEYPEHHFIKSNSVHTDYGGFEREVSKAIRHEKYELLEDGVRAINDIGLVKVKEPFVFDADCQPVAFFNPREKISENSYGSVIGWGKIDNWIYPDYLQHSELPLLSNQICNQTYLEDYGGILPGQICAGFINDDGEKNTFPGDSGSPLIVNNKILGVVTWTREPYGQPNSPCVFTEVPKYFPWIEENMK